MSIENPFASSTPESLSAEDMVALFVPYPHFFTLQNTGHQFLNGHRGSGKSTMLRMMTPECISAFLKKPIHELPYFGVYLSIKATDLDNPEYDRIENQVERLIIAEHVLCTRVLSAVFLEIKKNHDKLHVSCEEYIDFYSSFSRIMNHAMWENNEHGCISCCRPDIIMDDIILQFDNIQAVTIQYVKRRAFSGGKISYTGPLLSFLNTLIPILEAVKKHGLIKNNSLYLLLDDADNLSLSQTQVLNTWVSYRTTAIASLKISTQMRYKTKKTASSSNSIIEAPHDYGDIYFTAVQTGSLKEKYPNFVSDIVEKRLDRYGISKRAHDFFPEDQEQVRKISEIAEEIKKQWANNNTGGFRAGDDAYRWARPEYIRSLDSKNGHRYFYAGFEQLVHMSSGIIRYFLDPAAKMYAEQAKKNNGFAVEFIDPEIQDKVMRSYAEDFFHKELDKYRSDECVNAANGADDQDYRSLKNLIDGMGAVFRAFLIDKTQSQRRTFSFFLSTEPSPNVRRVLKLAVGFGYLYESSIVNKNGFGRTVLYVMGRRLSPIFKLDPIGFANHLSVTGEFIEKIMENPGEFTSRIRTKGVDSLLTEQSMVQYSLFEAQGTLKQEKNHD